MTIGVPAVIVISEGLRAGIGADGNRSDDALSLKISCLNASCTIEK